MGHWLCGGWCRRQLAAALKQKKRVSAGKGENNMHSQEADKTSQCHGMSGFLSQHFTSQGTHSTQELSLISAQWIHACGAVSPERSAVTEARGDGDVRVWAKAGRQSAKTCVFALLSFPRQWVNQECCLHGWLYPKIQTFVCVAQLGSVCGSAWQRSLDAGDNPPGGVCWTN